MKKTILTGLVICTFIIGGCQAKSHSQKATATTEPSTTETTSTKATSKTSTSTSSTATQQTTTSSTEQEAAALWDAEKDQQLQHFMAKWGAEMGQSYQRYDENHSTNYAGLRFPAEFANHTIAVNNSPISVIWSTNGAGDADYNVVAVYCDVDGGTVAGHLYLFTLHNQQPVVLYTSQNQAMPDKMLHFDETENQDLKNGFAEIIGNQQPAAEESSSVAAIGYEEAKALLDKAGIFFSDTPGWLVEETEQFDFTKGGNHVPAANGGIVLRQYSGARGFEEYTLTPNADGTVRIVWVTSAINDGRRTGIGVMKDVVVAR